MCIDTAIQSRNDLTPQCKNAATSLSVLINSKSLFNSVSTDHSALSEFCKPTCGPEIINTWRSCGAYNDGIQAEADFLSGLCGLHQEQPCYAMYDALEEAIDDTTFCSIATVQWSSLPHWLPLCIPKSSPRLWMLH